MSTSSSKAKTFTASWRASISLFLSGPSYVYERVCRAVNTETFRDVEAQALGLRGRVESKLVDFRRCFQDPQGTRGSPPPEPGARHPGSSRSPARPAARRSPCLRPGLQRPHSGSPRTAAEARAPRLPQLTGRPRDGGRGTSARLAGTRDIGHKVGTRASLGIKTVPALRGYMAAEVEPP